MRFQKHVHFFISQNSNPGALFQKKHPTAFASCISNLWLNLKLHFKRQESTSGCKEACSIDPVGIYGMCKYGGGTKHFRVILARTVLVLALYTRTARFMMVILMLGVLSSEDCKAPHGGVWSEAESGSRDLCVKQSAALGSQCCVSTPPSKCIGIGAGWLAGLLAG